MFFLGWKNQSKLPEMAKFKTLIPCEFTKANFISHVRFRPTKTCSKTDKRMYSLKKEWKKDNSPLEFNELHLKKDHFKRKLVFQPSFFKGYLGFRIIFAGAMLVFRGVKGKQTKLKICCELFLIKSIFCPEFKWNL